MFYDIAYKLARSLADELSPYCEQIEIAGGLRRRNKDVHDLDLVVIPSMVPVIDLLGHVHDQRSLLDEKLAELVESGRLTVGPKNGPRFKQYRLAEGIFLDLSVVLPPAQWGVLLALRTGPAHYSHWLVSRQERGGALPNHLQIRDGAVRQRYSGSIIETPTEQSFFDLLTLPMPAPADRTPAWSRMA